MGTSAFTPRARPRADFEAAMRPRSGGVRPFSQGGDDGTYVYEAIGVRPKQRTTLTLHRKGKTYHKIHPSTMRKRLKKPKVATDKLRNESERTLVISWIRDHIAAYKAVLIAGDRTSVQAGVADAYKQYKITLTKRLDPTRHGHMDWLVITPAGDKLNSVPTAAKHFGRTAWEAWETRRAAEPEEEEPEEEAEEVEATAETPTAAATAPRAALKAPKPAKAAKRPLKGKAAAAAQREAALEADDDVVVCDAEWQQMDLRCCISLAPLTDPAKGVGCKHLPRCNYGTLRAYAARMKVCPVAGCPAKLLRIGDAVRDDSLSEQLGALPAGVRVVWLRGDELRIDDPGAGTSSAPPTPSPAATTHRRSTRHEIQWLT